MSPKLPARELAEATRHLKQCLGFTVNWHRREKYVTVDFPGDWKGDPCLDCPKYKNILFKEVRRARIQEEINKR